ncbi:MAG: DNA repair protein RecO C-terminal domain-containing protein, partial [Pseudomonadota bacterium]
GRGRRMRTVMIPVNGVDVELSAKSDSQMPFALIELETSRAPWMTEPLPASAIQWACALTATALPERNAYPTLYQALCALLNAVCHAPSARGWLAAVVAYEAMLLRELGYGGTKPDMAAPFEDQFEAFRQLHKPLARYLLVDQTRDVMAARVALGERLARMMN